MKLFRQLDELQTSWIKVFVWQNIPSQYCADIFTIEKFS